MYGQSYRIEIGGLGGLSFYTGDANQTKLFEKVHPAYGVLMRYHLNRRFSIKGNLLSAGISGTTTDKLEQYPGAEALIFPEDSWTEACSLNSIFMNSERQTTTPGPVMFPLRIVRNRTNRI